MNNFKQDIIEAVGDDKPTIIVIEKFEKSYYEDKDKFNIGNSCANLPLDYNTGLNLLDYKYDSSCGAQDCHNIRVYSQNYIYYIHEYDGSTEVRCIERNPPKSNDPIQIFWGYQFLS